MGARRGMVSVDMIGYGPDFVVRTMGSGPQTMRYLLLADAKRQGLSASYLADPGPSGWSDHESFELAGIPTAWIEWRDDPVYHTTGDTPGTCRRPRSVSPASWCSACSTGSTSGASAGWSARPAAGSRRSSASDSQRADRLPAFTPAPSIERYCRQAGRRR